MGIFNTIDDLLLVAVDSKLDCAAPSDCKNGVALVTERRREGITPVQVWYGAWRDIRWAPDADEWDSFWGHLSDVYLLKRTKTHN